MIGAEPPKLQHRPHRARSGRARDPRAFARAAGPVRRHPGSDRPPGSCRRSGRDRRRLRQRPAGVARCAVRRGPPRARPAASCCSARDVARASAGRRRRQGLHYVPEERLGRGAVPTIGLAHNLLLTRREPVRAGGWLDLGRMTAMTREIIERFNVKAGGPGVCRRAACRAATCRSTSSAARSMPDPRC